MDHDMNSASNLQLQYSRTSLERPPLEWSQKWEMASQERYNKIFFLANMPVKWDNLLLWVWLSWSLQRAPTETIFNTLRPRQNGHHFADDTFKHIFLNENVCISIEISLKFVPKDQMNNMPALVQIMAWRRTGDKPLSESTRTTRTPAFWGYPPPPHGYPYHWVILDPSHKKTKSKLQI